MGERRTRVRANGPWLVVHTNGRHWFAHTTSNLVGDAGGRAFVAWAKREGVPWANVLSLN